MVSASVVVLEYVCPSLGVVTGNIMFAAPVRDCYRAVCAGKGLGSLHPTPWAFMLGNTIGWVAYGCLIQNLFVVVANAPGLIMSIWLNLQAVKMQYEIFRSEANLSVFEDEQTKTKDETNVQVSQGSQVGHDAENGQEQRDIEVTDNTDQRDDSKTSNVPTSLIPPWTHDMLVIANVALWIIVCMVVAFATALSAETKQLIVGFVVNSILVVFYGSPLSSIWTVLRSHNSATIHIPTMLTNTFNGVFWAAYGLAVQNWFITVPNLLGAGLGGVQFLLCLVFPRKAQSDASRLQSTAEADDLSKDGPTDEALVSAGAPR